MPDINRIRVVWTGIPTGNGVSTFYTEGGAVPNLAPLRAALANLVTMLPTGVTLTIQNQGDTITSEDGLLSGSWSTAAQAAIVGTGTGSYAAAVGACVNWQTDGFHNNRRLRGRTFFVPLISGFFGNNGALAAGAIPNLQGVINGVLGSPAPKYVIWGRPVRPKNPDGTPIAGSVAAGGTHSTITAGTVPTKGMVLTSRRD